VESKLAKAASGTATGCPWSTWGSEDQRLEASCTVELRQGMCWWSACSERGIHEDS